MGRPFTDSTSAHEGASMRVIGGILRTFIVLSILAGIGSAIGAFYAKSRLLSKGEPGDDELDLVAIYEGLNLASTAPALRRASYTAWYGGGTLDLRGAARAAAGAGPAGRGV